MSKTEVLVACMHQKDDSLYREMNLQTDAVFANQCDEYSYKEFTEPDGSKVKLISTADRGVGKNRNKALMNASGEYLLFSDEDMIYVDNYVQLIEDAFKTCPKADIIFFSLEYLNRFTPGRKSETKVKRVHLWNSMRYGVHGMVIKKSVLEKSHLSFSVLYGGGAKYSCGEDSLFIRDAFRKRLKMYAYPAVIAKIKQENSSWFRGFTEKYFVDQGILTANCFPILKHLIIYRTAFKLRKQSREFGFRDICRLMRRGFREYREM